MLFWSFIIKLKDKLYWCYCKLYKLFFYQYLCIYVLKQTCKVHSGMIQVADVLFGNPLVWGIHEIHYDHKDRVNYVVCTVLHMSFYRDSMFLWPYEWFLIWSNWKELSAFTPFPVIVNLTTIQQKYLPWQCVSALLDEQWKWLMITCSSHFSIVPEKFIIPNMHKQ